MLLHCTLLSLFYKKILFWNFREFCSSLTTTYTEFRVKGWKHQCVEIRTIISNSKAMSIPTATGYIYNMVPSQTTH